MTIVILVFIAQWYLSLFSQTFLLHCYASHGAFTMNKFWERVSYVIAYITMGSSYLSPRAYGIMHRMHHAYTDTPKDPHSPKYFSNVFAMMKQTANVYMSILTGNTIAEERFEKNLPDWPALDRWGHSWTSRIIWGTLYLSIYFFFAPSLWWYLLLPVQFFMSPVHGAIINWFAHKYGYRNFKLNNTSRNLLPVDLIMLGEAYHNNHHKYASNINFGVRWFEIDPVYFVIRLFNWLGIVKIRNIALERVASEF
ncbi:MAG: acyl-CoA desaturase [Chitinophagales bacterium]